MKNEFGIRKKKKWNEKRARTWARDREGNSSEQKRGGHAHIIYWIQNAHSEVYTARIQTALHSNKTIFTISSSYAFFSDFFFSSHSFSFSYSRNFFALSPIVYFLSGSFFHLFYTIFYYGRHIMYIFLSFWMFSFYVVSDYWIILRLGILCIRYVLKATWKTSIDNLFCVLTAALWLHQQSCE